MKKNFAAILICFFVFTFAFIMGSGQAEAIDKQLSTQILHLRINGHNIEIPLNSDGAFYDAQTLNTEFPNTFELLNKLEGVSIYIDGQKISTQNPVKMKIDKISYNKNIAIKVSDGSDIRTVYIRTLNSNIPTYTTAGQSPYEGDYYTTLLTFPIMLKFNKTGEIVYYQCANDYINSTVGAKVIMSYWDFKKHVLPNGEVLYSYYEQSPQYNRLNQIGYAGGTHVIMDEKYNEIDRIKMIVDKNSSVDVVEGHEFYLIDKNHYIVSNYELRLVHNIPKELNPHPQGSKVVATHLQEIKDGNVLFDWYSTDHPELYAISENPYNDFANIKAQQPDYAHFNSIDIDPNDGNFVCSFRNLSTILKINRKTGNIIWKLSGKADEFGLTDYQKTSNQHYARFTSDGYITIFDNGVFNKKSRVIKLKINEKEKTLTAWNEYIVPGHFSVICGNAMNLENEVFVIGWGYSTDNFASMTEIDFGKGKKLFEITFPAGMNATYRFAKYK